MIFNHQGMRSIWFEFKQRTGDNDVIHIRMHEILTTRKYYKQNKSNQYPEQNQVFLSD